MLKEYYVYKHIKNEVVFYIGSGKVSNRRAYGKNSRHKKWWDFCGGEFDTVIDSYHDNKKDAMDREKELIKEHTNTIVNMVSNGFNSMKGKKHSDEAREKMSRHWKENPRLKEDNPMYGRTGESNPNYGNGHKIAGRNNVNALKIIENIRGVCFYSIADARRELKISLPMIHKSLKTGLKVENKRKELFHFEYIEESV